MNQYTLWLLLLSLGSLAQNTNTDKIYTKSGRVLECSIDKVSAHEIFYNFTIKAKKYNSAILISQVDSVFNGQRYFLPSELQVDTTVSLAQPDSLLPPPEYRQDLLLSAPTPPLTQAQRMELAGYYLERSANQQLGAITTLAGSAIIGALLSNQAPEAATGIFWAGATVACVLEVSAIFQKRKAGRYLRNTY